MKRNDITKAERLLKSYLASSEMMSLDGGGYCLSVGFTNGGSKLFRTIEEVESWIEQREWEQSEREALEKA